MKILLTLDEFLNRHPDLGEWSDQVYSLLADMERYQSEIESLESKIVEWENRECENCDYLEKVVDVLIDKIEALEEKLDEQLDEEK